MGKTNDTSELMTIPGVGKTISRDFMEMGYATVESLKGQDPEEMYLRHCSIKGFKVDRCFLYVCRCAVYYAENTEYDPKKLRWWNWKD